MDEAQQELLRTFPGEIALGEALMYVHGWTVGVVREGLQALAAEEGLESSGLQDVDVWRWLRGEVYPRESLERLCRLFRCHQAQLGWPARGNDLPISFGPGAPANALVPSPPLPAVPSRPAGREPWADGRQDWAAWFGVELSRLIALVEQWQGAPSCEPLQHLVHQEVLMIDASRPLPGEDRGHDPSRRQFLVTLVALPVALVPSVQLGGASSILVGRLLAQCAASITAGWHLLRQADFAIVEQQVSGYLLALTALARQPSPHQAEAARLASQAYRVLGVVALHRRQLGLMEHLRQEALRCAEIADDPFLQASALLSLADAALLYRNDPTGATSSHQRALRLEPEITPLQRSRLHASLALENAMRGQEQEALRQLQVAEEAYPARPTADPTFLNAEFTPGSLILLQGLTYLALARELPDQHHQERAWETFEQVGRLSAPDGVAERVRVEIVNHQAATAVEMRDLERFVAHLSLGVQGARDLRSAQRLHEARAAWRRALQVWPTERRLAALADLFSDTPPQLGAARS